MNVITKIVGSVDTYQQKHKVPGFVYAVIKRYGEDNGSYQSAIITYYALLSLFPLLIVFTSLTQLILRNNTALKARVASSINHYFPILGNQLNHNIHGVKGTGLAVIISLLITFYGARGFASALQYALTNLWKVPKIEQPPFLKNLVRNLSIMVIGGLGLVVASTLSTFVAVLGHDIFIKILAILLSAIVLWITLIYVFKLSVAGNKTVRQVFISAAVAAVGLQILQSAGSIILSHELKGLSNGYGTFALVIGLSFWFYLQAELIIYAVEIDVVRNYHLYPRSLTSNLNEQDKSAYSKDAKANKRNVKEKIKVSF